MNTMIARRLNEAVGQVDSVRAVQLTGSDVTDVHNGAVRNGFLSLPTLEFIGGGVEGAVVELYVAPSSGMMNIGDLWGLKEAWGADDVYVYTVKEEPSVALVYRLK